MPLSRKEMPQMAENTTQEVTEATASEAQVEGATPEQDEPLREPGKRALQKEREAREQAESRLKELEARLSEMEGKDQSEAEKVAQKLAEAERKAAEIEARANRAEVAAETGIPSDILAGPKSARPADLHSFAERVAAFVAEASKNKAGPVVPSQGQQPEAKPKGSADEWLRGLLAG